MGVDGCRSGWFAVWREADQLDFGVYRTFKDIWHQHNDLTSVLVDVPIGLTSDQPRLLESEIRKLLAGRTSSVFSVPCRDAVYAMSYEDACDINFTQFGKKISRQSWNICPRIRDMDTFLLAHQKAINIVGESHPELIFTLLAGGMLQNGKKRPEGLDERLVLLREHDPSLQPVFSAACKKYRRKDVAKDDIVDAMALLVACDDKQILSIGADTGIGGIPIRMHVPSFTGIVEGISNR